MRIQCKGCGKEYQVNEERLTPEGIRVRCKSCGTVLLVRLRQEQKASPAAEEAAPSIREENRPEDVPSISPSEAPVEIPRPQKVSKPDPAPSGYRYCIACGKLLEKALSVEDRPVCATCSSMAYAGAPGTVSGITKQQTSASSLKKVLLFILVIVIVFFAGVMGYRIAGGEISSMNFLSRHIENFISPENVVIPIREVEQFLSDSEEF